MVVFSNKKVLNLESLHTVFSLRKKCLYSELFWSAFFPHFSAFGLNIRKIRTRITPNTTTFYAVNLVGGAHKGYIVEISGKYLILSIVPETYSLVCTI